MTAKKQRHLLQQLRPQWINKRLLKMVALPFLISFLSQLLVMFIFHWIH